MCVVMYDVRVSVLFPYTRHTRSMVMLSILFMLFYMLVFKLAKICIQLIFCHSNGFFLSVSIWFWNKFHSIFFNCVRCVGRLCSLYTHLSWSWMNRIWIECQMTKLWQTIVKLCVCMCMCAHTNIFIELNASMETVFLSAFNDWTPIDSNEVVAAFKFICNCLD